MSRNQGVNVNWITDELNRIAARLFLFFRVFICQKKHKSCSSPIERPMNACKLLILSHLKQQARNIEQVKQEVCGSAFHRSTFKKGAHKMDLAAGNIFLKEAGLGNG